jgi:hypothetical protein
MVQVLRKWAYWTGYLPIETLHAELEKMGEQGWELCSSTDALKYIAGRHSTYCVFKRPGDVIERCSDE